jgi:hypothetical protein
MPYNASHRTTRWRPRFVAGVLLLALVSSLALASRALACPFCTALKPTLSQRREAAAVVVLGEFVAQDGKQAAFRLHQFLQGQPLLADVKVAGEGGSDRLRIALEGEAEFKTGALVVLFGDAATDHKTPTQRAGEREPAAPREKLTTDAKSKTDAAAKSVKLSWSHVSVSELGFAYLARAPSLRKDTAERLRYFARYLEHDDPLIAEDAYQEFGHAAFDEVAKAADALDHAKLRQWLADEGVRDYRKGFYGVALGLAKSDADRKANGELIRKLIDEQSDDFVAGFDGLLGGYLLLAGEAGLKHLEERYLANPKSADGHVRHAISALRFYAEYGREIPRTRLRNALRRLLDRPEFAATAIVDLARWQDWESLEPIAGLYGQKAYDTLTIKRAIVGYLLVCPGEMAAKHLDALRRSDPKTVADAEKSLSLFGGNR